MEYLNNVLYIDVKIMIVITVTYIMHFLEIYKSNQAFSTIIISI